MTESSFRHIGPLTGIIDKAARKKQRRSLPLGFLLIVLLPTAIAAIYYLLIATPRYVVESRFIVRAPDKSQPSSLGVALQGVGITNGQAETFAVHEYIVSRGGLRDLESRQNVREIFGSRGADFFSRYPRPWENEGREGLFKAYKRFVDVGYDSTTGISTLKVEAFRAQDARAMAVALLSGSEDLVNRLNIRAERDAVADATLARQEAQSRVASVQQRLTAYRNREGYIDPALAAKEGSELIGSLLTTIATLEAERRQIASETPQNPQLGSIDSRIAAYRRQVETERAKLTGSNASLAPRISAYEDLVSEREIAEIELRQSTASLLTAQQDARRQRLYLDQIVVPDLPDRPLEPKRWFAILTVLMSSLLVYGVGWLIWAGVKEHRQT